MTFAKVVNVLLVLATCPRLQCIMGHSSCTITVAIVPSEEAGERTLCRQNEVSRRALSVQPSYVIDAMTQLRRTTHTHI